MDIIENYGLRGVSYYWPLPAVLLHPVLNSVNSGGHGQPTTPRSLAWYGYSNSPTTSPRLSPSVMPGLNEFEFFIPFTRV